MNIKISHLKDFLKNKSPGVDMANKYTLVNENNI